MKKTLLYATILTLLLSATACNQATPSGSRASQGDPINMTDDTDHFPSQE